MIKIPPFVDSLRPYKAGKQISELAREKKLDKIVKLASGENPIGPSPMAVEAMRKALLSLNRYPDPGSYDLVHAIADKYQIQPNHIICGHGSDSMLSYIVEAFAREDDEIVTSEGTFSGIYFTIRKKGRKLITVPMINYQFDLEGILNAITDQTTMIYIANPNNPTGTMIRKSEFENFMDRVPDHVMVVLDEAYTVYAKEHKDYPNGVGYDYENMVVTRTFSKAYGLAGLRIGFAVGPDKVIEALYKVKLPFEPHLLAQDAAIAALKDDSFLQQTLELNKRSLGMLIDFFKKNQIQYVPSYTNFLLALMPDEQFASSFAEGCLNQGLIIRHVDSFGFPNGIRINSGTIEETQFAIEVMEKVYKELFQTTQMPIQ